MRILHILLLNLAQAVMVCAYEMRQTLLSDSGLLPIDQRNSNQAQKATIGSINAAMDTVTGWSRSH
jgi:tRNA C32,U32 (ribose-2'-O)-methylase TrmJ